MRKSLRMIFPMSFKEDVWQYICQQYKNILPNAELSASFLSNPQPSILSDFDQFQIAPEILHLVQSAEKQNCDGIFLNVAFDTALSAAKTLVNIPVVGALESAIILAKYCQYQKVSVLAINDEEIVVNYRLFNEYGYRNNLVSVETIDIPVFSLQENKSKTIDNLRKCCKNANSLGTECIILGCTAMGWLAEIINNEFGIKVIDTSVAGLLLLDTLTELKLTQNKNLFINPTNINTKVDFQSKNPIYSISQ